ncbi:hypothetical protein ABT224_16015 [Streptomyces sp. NPDC001584]|uniref:hypothetical protein n=1 Tax=Streptomyces sp. NPDC001584 TaxID=3154521 RepID=UPI0033227A2D
MDDTGETDRTVTADRLLGTAERAFLHAEFRTVRPLLRRFQNEFGTVADDTAVRYAVLRGALSARAGNWPEAVRWCPDVDDLDVVPTGVVHALAVSALRRLTEEGRHTESGTAAVAIMLWAYLLDEEDAGDFRELLTGRRGTPVSEDLWEEARGQLAGRVTELLHALDVRAGRDALTAWATAWEAECVVPVVVPADAGPDGLIPLGDAAWHLLDQDRRHALLDAYTARHPDLGSWTAASPDHHPCAAPLSRALAARGHDRLLAGEWSEALTDFSTAARLGRTPDTADEAAVLRAGASVGRTRNGRGYSALARILGLELAHALLPRNSSLATELAAELVQQGRKVFGSDPVQSRNRFARALAVSPQDQDARSGLDDHLRANLVRARDKGQPLEEIHADAVKDLLRRDPDYAPALSWLQENSTLRAGVDPTRAGLERSVDLLGAAVDIADPDDDHAREEHAAAVLALAEHLEATASPSDVIELFLRDRLRIGVSARFDQTVKAAYVRRAESREEEGDIGGARHDRECAARIGAGLPDQGLLFGPSTGSSQDDSGQGALF